MTQRNPPQDKRLLFVVNHAEFFVSHRLPLALEAKKRGLSVSVATSSTPAVKILKDEGIPVHILPLQPGGMNPVMDLKLFVALCRLYKKERPALVHQVTIKPVMWGSLAARVARVPAVINAMSGLGYLYIAKSFKTKILRAVIAVLLKTGMRHPRLRMILQNPDDQAAFVDAGILKPEQVRLIRGSGVDPDVFRPHAEKEGIPVVLLPARLLWDKGVGEFVEAAKILKKKGVNARYVLVGESDKNNPKVVDEAIVKEWESAGWVEWWGMQDDMPNIYEQAHIVCLPSYREGLPKSLIEAASCGRALVSTDVPGCREIVKNNENGLLVPVRDAEALAQAIHDLIDSPERRQAMGAKGREMVLESFALEQVIKHTFAVYDELI